MIKLFYSIWINIKKPRKFQFIILILLMIFASFVEVFSIGAVLPFLGVLSDPERAFHQQIMQPFVIILGISEANKLLFPLAIIFATAALISGLMRLILLWVQTRFCSSLGSDFSTDIFRNILYESYSKHVARSNSEILAAISNKTTYVVYHTLFPFMTLISSLFILIGILFVLIIINPIVAISVMTVFGLFYLIISLITKQKMMGYSNQVNIEQNNVIKILQESLNGIREILINGSQETYCKIFYKADYSLRRSQANVLIIGSGPRFGVEAIGIIIITALSLWMVESQNNFATVVPILGAMALGAQRLLPVLQQAFASWTAIRGSRSSCYEVLKLLKQDPTKASHYIEDQQIIFKNSIELTSVYYRHSEGNTWNLRDINLKINKSSRIGIIGATGSGKSTLLDVLLGLLPPVTGQLLIDGVAIDLRNQRSWQGKLAHVPQDIFLSDTSITENIAFGVHPDLIDHALVSQAASISQIDKTIQTWINKYDTLVGERGVRLSGGQRQRIGIARALYKKAEVIVFDEATSALDSETEEAVMNGIEKLGTDVTLIIVAHRISTLKNCSKIIEMENGCIKRIATYQEIKNKDVLI